MKIIMNNARKLKFIIYIFLRVVFILLPIVAILFVGCAVKSKQMIKTNDNVAATIDTPINTTINVIKNIVINKQSITITADRNFKYNVLKLTDPFKLVVELKSVEQGRFIEAMVSENSTVSQILFSKRMVPDEATILEITLSAPLAVEHNISENNLTIKFLTEEEVETSKKSEDEVEALLTKGDKGEKAPLLDEFGEEIVLEPLKNATTITNITFKRDLEYVKVIIKGDGSMMPDVFQIDNRVILDIPRVNITAKVPQQVPIPIDNIRWGDSDNKIRMVISLKEHATFDVIAFGDEIVVSLTSPEIAQEGKEIVTASSITTVKDGAKEGKPVQGDEKVYTGKRISLDIQNADVPPILRLFAEISGKNVIIDPKINGKINMKLVNVPWDQALELILKLNNLAQITEGNIIRIVPSGSIVKEKNDSDAILLTKPLVTRLFPVNYKDISQMLAVINDADILSKGADGKEKRGKITIDATAQVLIVNDIEETFPKIQKLIDMLDTPDLQVRQVLIEARIVEVSASYSKSLGIIWNSSGGTGSDANTLNWTTGINMPVGGTSIGFGYIPTSGTNLLNATLSVLESQSKGKIISNPRILTMNNVPATISQGNSVFMSSVSSTGAASVNEIKAVISLSVTPSISPGGTVRLTIAVTKDEMIGEVGGKPAKTTNTINTVTTVKSGETVVIGGIYKQNSTIASDSVPFLSKIPILGWLFKNDRKTKNDNELMVFITPRVVSRMALGDTTE